MAPTVKRKSSKEGSGGAVSDGAMGPPPAGGSVGRGDGATSASDVDEEKRFKPGSPLIEDSSTSVVGVSDAVGAFVRSGKRNKRKSRADVPVSGVERMQSITAGLYGVVIKSSLDASDKEKLMAFAQRYEGLLIELMGENARMKGLYDGAQQQLADRSSAVGASAAVLAGPAVDVAGGASVPKVVNTWAVVVKDGEGVSTSKEVVEKVMKDVAPSLGVRMHEVRPTKDGGAVIRTPSVAERQKILENEKFKEVGLEVSVKDKLGPKIVVQNVLSALSPDEFMEELYAMNLGEMMSKKEYKKSVRMVSAPWRVGDDYINVTLECTDRIAEHLRVTGVYVKWLRFMVRMVDVVPACHRCYSFDHRVRDCKLKENICRLCGQSGHLASRCCNPAHCRNCALRRKVADHPMMSMQCPVYAAMVARANARH